MNQTKDTKRLFDAFPPVSTEEWMKKIIADLKGADFDKRLVWHNENGFEIQPFYREEQRPNWEYMQAPPEEFPYVRSTKGENVWEIRQKIYSKNPPEANERACEAAERGATGVSFDATEINDVNSLKVLLHGIDLSQTAIHFRAAKNYLELAKLLQAYFSDTNIDAATVKGSFNFDSLSYRLLHGKYYGSPEQNIRELIELTDFCGKHLPAFKLLSVNAAYYHNAGATQVQELAFALSAAAEYLHQLTEAGKKAEEVLPVLAFHFGIGSSYFMEIAKFRAFRLLWANVAKAFGVPEEKAKAYIHAVSSNRNKTLFDPYVNMLRTTTEAMSGGIAGVDAMTILPFDNIYNNENHFANRIARNQQIIIKEEAHLDKVVDPAAGSYYVEQLTDSLIAAAWELFLKIEDIGGYAAALDKGFISNEITAAADRRDAEVAKRKISILGTNQYPNQQEQMLDKIVRELKPDFEGLRMYRMAEPFEQLRLNTEIHVQRGGKRPKVFLLTYGNLAMRKARAGFASNFFAVAGYEIIDNAGFELPENGAKAALEAEADLVVLCSSDEDYLGLAMKVNDYFNYEKKQPRLIVAGYPKDDIDHLKEMGVQDFIHVKSNLLESLRKYNQLLGIE
jgi:methylmalonyl-CoA mutase